MYSPDIWNDQIDAAVRMGLPEKLGLSAEEYKAGLPQFSPQSETYEGRFPVPLFVDPRFDPTRVFSFVTALGLFHAASRLTLHERSVMGNLIDIPDEPYQLWVHIEDQYKRLSIPQFKSQMAPDGRGLTLIEGFFLARSLKHLIPTPSIDLLETETRRNGVTMSLVIASSAKQPDLLDIGVQSATKDDYIKLPFIAPALCRRF